MEKKMYQIKLGTAQAKNSAVGTSLICSKSRIACAENEVQSTVYRTASF